MPPKPIIDLAKIDLEQTIFDGDQIGAVNPHRYEMALLDRIVHFDLENREAAGVRRVPDDEFWVRGHFPGRPTLPGVLMVESAAQLCSFVRHSLQPTDRILGFAAADQVRFRRNVVPGDELVIAGRMIEMKTRVARFQAQGFVEGQLAFECMITGMEM